MDSPENGWQMAENSDFSTHTPRPAPQGSPTRGIVLKLVSNCAANSMAESTTHVILYQEPWSAAAPGATSKATDFPTLPIKSLSPALSCGIVVSWDGWGLFVAFNYIYHAPLSYLGGLVKKM
jgi:hypothetical protein